MCVRSSTTFYSSFNLDMDRSPGFGSMLCDFVAQLRLGFPSAPHFMCLTLPHHITRRTVLQKVRGCTHRVLPQLVDTGFQVLFHSPPGVLFTFPSQYYALSVTKEYLALEGGPSDFPQGFSCLVVLRILPLSSAFEYEAFTLSGRLSQNLSSSFQLTYAVHNPGTHALRFRLFPFRSPLLRKSMFLSLPPGT